MWSRDQPQREGSPEVRRPDVPAARRGVATLGPSIFIKGTLSGGEDLVIEGRLEGEVALHEQHVTIGKSGRVQADVYGSSICVEGEVNGNLFGKEQVVIRQSGKVRGNVTAPRVNLENGAKFKGAIDMQPGSAGAKAHGQSAAKQAGDSPRAEHGQRRSKESRVGA